MLLFRHFGRGQQAAGQPQVKNCAAAERQPETQEFFPALQTGYRLSGQFPAECLRGGGCDHHLPSYLDALDRQLLYLGRYDPLDGFNLQQFRHGGSRPFWQSA